MALEPNKEQINFIESKNSNVLVSASAGSGKTYSMIQKLIHILCVEKTPINSLLVLTFTEAAASEIKQRLYNEISNVMLTDEDNREFLQKQLDNINNAEIGTLHSVCKKLIIKYFYQIDQSPDFAVLSEKESKYLLDNAISRVFEKHITDGDDLFFELYECYNAKRNDTTLKSLIVQLLGYIDNKPDYLEWKNQFIADSYNMSLNDNQVCMYLYNVIKNRYREYVACVLDLIEQAKTLAMDKYVDFLYSRKNIIEQIINANDFVSLVKILASIELPKKPNSSKNMSALELDLDEHVAAFNKRLSDTIKKSKEDIVFLDVDEISNNFAVTKTNVSKLMEIAEEIKSEYSQAKKAKNYLDFNDLEDKMLALLDIKEVQEVLRQTYSYVFFDEYQDINEKQERILLKIVSHDNYYMIGDVKQSIYAFRQSSPKIFINKFNQFKDDNVSNKLINFNKNYRSDRNILEFNNFVFDTLITEKTIGVDYKSNSRFQTDNEFDGCHVDMRIIDSVVENDEDVDLDRSEAIVIADTISKILTMTKKDGAMYTYKDIAIILRKRGSFLQTLCDVLTSMQIPINTTINYDFFGTNEIQLLIAILKVISNYQDDIALSIVLKNLFKLNENELMEVRKNSDKKYFYECVADYSISDEIKNKIDAMFAFIKDSKTLLSKLTLKEFMEKVIADFNLINYLKSMPDGEDLESNVYEFLALIDNELYNYNLDKFLDYLEYISKDTSLQNIGVGGNSVQICTIHYSKGLEYPAVIFGGLGKKFSLNKDTNDMIINANFGVGLKAIDSENRILHETLIRNACKIQNKQEELNEEIRLMYVAMTRPREYLCLIGQYNLDKYNEIKSKSIYSVNNYFDMLFKAVTSKNDMDFVSRKKKFVLNDNESQANVEIISADEIVDNAQIVKSDIIIDASNEELEKLLKTNYLSRPNLESHTIKNTVTNVLREETDYENLNYEPKNLNEKDKLVSKDYLKIGTAYHTMMEKLDFTESKEDIENLKQKLIRNNDIPIEIAEDIKVDEIFMAKENLKDLILGAKAVYKEKQFVMQENYNKLVKNSDNNTKIIIQGIIDLVVITNAGNFLIDYKTNRTTNLEQLISDYSLQLEIYKMAFEKATNLKIDKKFLYSFYMKKLIEVK